jgi:bifunctional UDP-N-acetylglucosamine pyrophosphorylase/glucosamine-1-phosphate N-acetyltransferase
MKSELPKVVHPILGQPMVTYVIDAVKAVGSEKATLVVGYKSELVKEKLSQESVDFVEQPDQLGTGHAVQCFAKECKEIPENLLVVCGDTPLISQQTLKVMIETHLSEKPAITMMTLDMEEPGNYGRIIRKDGNVIAIREAKDCSEVELKVKEVNLAVYLFDGKFLFDNIFKLENNNRQKEYYLTDLVEMAVKQDLAVIATKEKDEASTLGINSRVHLAMVSEILKKQILDKHMEAGVTIVDPAQTLIGPKAEIEPDTTVWPGSTIIGKTKIDKDCNIGPQTFISSSKIGKNIEARFCVINDALLADQKKLQPFSTISGTEAQ